MLASYRGDEIKEIKKTSHIGHCTHTAGSTTVKVQNIFHWRNNITCSTSCNHRRGATLYEYAVESWFVSGIQLYTLPTGDNKDNNILMIMVQL